MPKLNQDEDGHYVYKVPAPTVIADSTPAPAVDMAMQQNATTAASTSTVDQSTATKPVLTLTFSSRKRGRESIPASTVSAKKATKVKSEITATTGDESGDVTVVSQNPAASTDDGKCSSTDYDMTDIKEEKLKLKSRLQKEDETPRTVTICIGKFNSETDAQRAYKKVTMTIIIAYNILGRFSNHLSVLGRRRDQSNR